jgi:SOS-response transcriptional repressor LexA
MNIEDRIKQVATEKEIPLKTLAIRIDMTETGFYAMLRNKSMKVETLLKISKVLGVEPASFFSSKPGTEVVPAVPSNADFYAGTNIRILPIVVDKEENERISFVPIKAAAGYLTRYQDVEYIQQLPSFNLPNLKDGTYRAFEVEGDSMKPTIHPGDIVICRYVENWYHMMDNKIYLVAGVDGIGIVVKRVLNRIRKESKLILCSENDFYPAFELPANEIFEIWEVKVKVSTNLEPPLYMDNRLRKFEESINSVVGMLTKVIVSER